MNQEQRNGRTVAVSFVQLPHGEGLALPSYQTAGAAGADLLAAVQETMVIAPGKMGLVPTGLSVAIPEGHELQIRPRSGLAVRDQVTVLNAPGTIDADYRGEIKVALINFGDRVFVVNRGDRIAQGILAKVERIRWVPAGPKGLPETARDSGGFGHTGR